MVFPILVVSFTKPLKKKKKDVVYNTSNLTSTGVFFFFFMKHIKHNQMRNKRG